VAYKDDEETAVDLDSLNRVLQKYNQDAVDHAVAQENENKYKEFSNNLHDEDTLNRFIRSHSGPANARFSENMYLYAKYISPMNTAPKEDEIGDLKSILDTPTKIGKHPFASDPKKTDARVKPIKLAIDALQN